MARSVGLAQGCIDECVRYVNERQAFGKTIGHYQVIQFKLADMQARTHTARLAYFDAAQRMAKERPSRSRLRSRSSSPRMPRSR